MFDAIRSNVVRHAAAVTVVTLGALIAAQPVCAKVYKWVDEKGVTHYSDNVPPEHVNRAATQLDKSGTPIKRTDPALTPEQRKARDDEEITKREMAKAATEQKRKDDALLNSYTDETEIRHVRQRNISVVEDVIATNQRRLAEMRTRRQELEAERVALEKQGKSLPAAKQRELKSIEIEIPSTESLVTQKARDVEALKAKYDSDLRRYRALAGASVAQESTGATAKKAQRSEAPRNEAPAAQAVDPAVEKAVIGVMSMEDLVQQTEDFCMRALPTSFKKYNAAATSWKQRNAAVVAQARRVLSEAFNTSDRQLIEAGVKARNQHAFAPHLNAPMASKIKWCDRLVDEINNGAVDVHNKPNMSSPLANYRPR